jgi:serine/threonine protein kinase
MSKNLNSQIFSNSTRIHTIISSIDRGTFSRVFEAQNKETGERVAIKIIEKSELSNPERAHREVEIMKMCNHPHIVKLIDVFDDPERTFLVMEL